MRKYYAVSLESVDYMPASLPLNSPNTRLTMCEDNDAVIKMLMKGRAPILKHCGRTQRVDLDFLFEQLREDPAILCRYIHTTQQVADILTKGVFTAESWGRLIGLLRLGPPPKSVSFISPKSVRSAAVQLVRDAMNNCWQTPGFSTMF